MIIVKLYTEEINYNSFVDLTMPYLVRWLSKKDNAFLKLFTNIINKEEKLSKFSKLLIDFLPNKNNLAAYLLPRFQNVFIEFLNEWIRKNNLKANIKAIDFKTVERSRKDMLKIEVIIDDIDYEQSFFGLTPIILNIMAEQEGKSGNIAKLLISKKELPGNVLKAAISAIPKEQRDELLAVILMEYEKELTDTINQTIVKNNIKAKVSAIDIKSYNE